MQSNPNRQINRLVWVIVFMGVGIILAIRQVAEAVTGDHVWFLIYGWASWAAWVFGGLLAKWGQNDGI